METNRAAANRGGDKTTSVGLDWPQPKEARCTRGQEGPRVEPTGETQEREMPTRLEMHENVTVGKRGLT